MDNRLTGPGLRLSGLLVAICFGVGCAGARVSAPAGDLAWPTPTRTARPWTRWWWPGSAVDRAGLTRELEAMAAAGIGGVEITPIYGARGAEDRYLDFLSPPYLDLLEHAGREARRLDLGVDMATGTGWPFGGPWVTPAAADARVALADGRLESRPTRKMVERAAPGGEGLVVNPFSATALGHYLAPIGRALAKLGPTIGKLAEAESGSRAQARSQEQKASPDPRLKPGATGNSPLKRANDDDGTKPNLSPHLIRAQFHDSFEYEGNWTPELPEAFMVLHGYDLRQHAAELFGQGDPDAVARVKSDYRQMLAGLHLQYVRAWTRWAHDRGFVTRDQAHGAPGNLLDLYAAVDIPETEMFGPIPFAIPGLRPDTDRRRPTVPSPLVPRLASSAAHVAGRPLVSSESFTWMRDHFKGTLAEMKPEADLLFLSGINHIFFHGTCYSASDAAWPGWLFYASTQVNPRNTLWRNLPALNAYVTRCQSILQAGRPDNDVLLYWPVFDVWNTATGMERPLGVGRADWLDDSPCGLAAIEMLGKGYAFDFVSDSQLQATRCEAGDLLTTGGRYRVVLVPQCGRMPPETLGQLLTLARAGGSVLFVEALPEDVPGLARLHERRGAFDQLKRALTFAPSGHGAIEIATLGRGEVLLGRSVDGLLRAAGVRREPLADSGLSLIRRAAPDGHDYFIANQTATAFDGWAALAVPARSAAILDPQTGAAGVAALRPRDGGVEVYLQLQPGQSAFVRARNGGRVEGTAWRYLVDAGEPARLTGRWEVRFIEGGPELPPDFTTTTLATWTDLGGAAALRFAGTARYRLEFDAPAGTADDWLLDLGDVRESARVRLNGRAAGTLWCVPFRVRVGALLRPGRNVLEVEATNLAANRIRDLDRRGVTWKIFRDINFVDINYRPFDASRWPLTASGLLGPVTLKPLREVRPGDRPVSE